MPSYKPKSPYSSQKAGHYKHSVGKAKKLARDTGNDVKWGTTEPKRLALKGLDTGAFQFKSKRARDKQLGLLARDKTPRL